MYRKNLEIRDYMLCNMTLLSDGFFGFYTE